MPLILRHTDLRIQAERAWLDALLSHAPDVRGLVIVALPVAAQLRNSREDHTARLYRDAGFATLIVSLLTPYEEARDPDVRYDIPRLTQRLEAVLHWAEQQPTLAQAPSGGDAAPAAQVRDGDAGRAAAIAMPHLPCALLAVGTVAAAAVRFAVRYPQRLLALVSRAGRIDLAGAEPLRRLAVPICAVVPTREAGLEQQTEPAYRLIGADKRWQTLDADASLLTPGSLDTATRCALDWVIGREAN